MTDPKTLEVAVVVASVGRAESLGHLLGQLAVQSQLPSQVVLSVETEADLPPETEVPFPLDTIVQGPRGLTMQRNRGLERLKHETDIVVFYDDDFVPTRTAIADIARFFSANPDIAGADGLVLADGATGPGVTIDVALQIVGEAERSRIAPDLRVTKPADALYGCNMAYRYHAVKDLRFDEDLPLYAWFEDLDFGARVDGQLAHCQAFQGVHRAEKKGREKGRRLGYSQVANPIYMARKGTLTPSYCFQAVLRRVAMNHLRLGRSEPWVDRRGRAIGNWMAFSDLLRGRMHPSRILEI